jgi:hypothetical protein
MNGISDKWKNITITLPREIKYAGEGSYNRRNSKTNRVSRYKN